MTAAATAAVLAMVMVVMAMIVVMMAVVVIMMVMLMAMVMIVMMVMIVIVMHNKFSFFCSCVFLNYIRWPGHCQNIYFSASIPPPGLRNR